VAGGKNGYVIISEDFGKTWKELDVDLVAKTILEDRARGDADDIIKVKFIGEKAVALGREGIYEISF
jgi:hypothetical protein